MHLIHHDLETFSPVEIKSAGAYAYLQHPETDLLCMSYWLEGNDIPTCFRVGHDSEPTEFLDAIENGDPVACWNSGFEWAAWQYLLPRLYPHWPKPKLEQFHDIQAWALASALPPALGSTAQALGLPEQKDDAGRRIMMKLSRPRKWNKDGTYTRWHYEDAPEDFDHLYSYCDQDVATEAAVAKVVRPLTPKEREVWLEDQRINDRGIHLDLQTVEPARKLVFHLQSGFDRQMSDLTMGLVTAATQNKAITEFVDALCPDREVKSIAKDQLRDLLAADDVPEQAKAVLRLRKEAGKTSLAKFDAMAIVAGSTGTAQGAFQYHRSTTGRWGGKGTQPQNMPRPRIKAHDVQRCVEIIRKDPPQVAEAMLQILYGPPADVLSWCLRGMFIPKPGYEFVGGDFANIEGRVLAWLAGETWKLQAFRDADAGTGADLYRIAYGNSFGVDPASLTKDGDERQIGKRQELQLGYQGGVGAFISSQKQDGFNFEELSDAVYSAADAGAWAEAERKRQFLQLEKKQHTWLAPKVYTALRYLTDTWRENNPAIKSFWVDINECALNAVKFKGEPFSTQNNKLTFSCGKHFLYCRLPSGRILSYARPSLEMVFNEIMERDELVLQYWAHGKDKNNPGKFAAVQSYGGLLAENVTQAVARDIQAEAILRLKKARYPVVLHVHDEDRCQVPIGTVDPLQVQKIMEVVPSWARGLPIAAECEIMSRYHK